MAGETRQARFEALAQFITALPPYETPEIVQIAITAGSAAYLRWVDDEQFGMRRRVACLLKGQVCAPMKFDLFWPIFTEDKLPFVETF